MALLSGSLAMDYYGLPWSQAPLTLAVKEGFNLLFRNLDATATLLRTVELRGKTIQNVSTCTGYSMMGPMGVQKCQQSSFLPPSSPVCFSKTAGRNQPKEESTS